MRAPKLFISYSAPDSDWTRAFASALREIGVDVWFAEFDIRPGDLIGEAVEAGFRNSDIIILLINDDIVRSNNFFFELGAALGMNKKIISIVPEDFTVAKLPLSIQRRRHLVLKSPEVTAKELAIGLEFLQGEVA